MQSEIEEFLRKNSPKLFLAVEVADMMQISRSSAQRQLKKLAAKGVVIVKEGRYGYVTEEPPPPEHPLEAKLESLAELTGVPQDVIEGWAAELRSKKKGTPKVPP
ncbi:MAG: HTH domain-containing protein [Thaumarchaeota archaeon]|nr:HTH domain-containing protein [Nitrososphaerota archaeon]